MELPKEQEPAHYHVEMNIFEYIEKDYLMVPRWCACKVVPISKCWVSDCLLQLHKSKQKLVFSRWFSDKIYWQVADQPGKGGPNCLVMVDLVGKEVKRCCHP
jgi:hypothetical protein